MRYLRPPLLVVRLLAAIYAPVYAGPRDVKADNVHAVIANRKGVEGCTPECT